MVFWWVKNLVYVRCEFRGVWFCPCTLTPPFFSWVAVESLVVDEVSIVVLEDRWESHAAWFTIFVNSVWSNPMESHLVPCIADLKKQHYNRIQKVYGTTYVWLELPKTNLLSDLYKNFTYCSRCWNRTLESQTGRWEGRPRSLRPNDVALCRRLFRFGKFSATPRWDWLSVNMKEKNSLIKHVSKQSRSHCWKLEDAWKPEW